MSVDWNDPKCPVSRHFTVKEALWLPQWSRMATEADGLTDEVKNNLIALFKILDTVRDYFGKPMNVHVTFRPEEYNELVKGAKNSAHKYGKACDFDIVGLDCDKARELLEPCLSQWNLRMEQNPGGNWVHLDTNPPNPNRYFKP